MVIPNIDANLQRISSLCFLAKPPNHSRPSITYDAFVEASVFFFEPASGVVVLSLDIFVFEEERGIAATFKTCRGQKLPYRRKGRKREEKIQTRAVLYMRN